MKLPHHEFIRYENWKEQFLRNYKEITPGELEKIAKEVESIYPEAEERFLKAMLSMYLGGYEKRVQDPEIMYWTNWAGVKTYKTFNKFPQLSDIEVSFLFYSIGKVFVPLLLHERGVKSQAFKRLSKEEQEKVVQEELDVIWENHLIRILQILPFLSLNSKSM
ncbi:MAG: hypothetical protein ACK4LA_04865 [Aquificaceae bacterium]